MNVAMNFIHASHEDYECDYYPKVYYNSCEEKIT